MMLLEVNRQCVPVFKFKGQTPRAIDMDRIALRLPFQWIKIEARHIQFLQACGGINTIKPATNSVMESSINPALAASPELNW